MNSRNEHLHPIHRKLKHSLCVLGPWTLDLGLPYHSQHQIPNITNRDIVTSYSAIENPIDTIQISQQIKMIFGWIKKLWF